MNQRPVAQSSTRRVFATLAATLAFTALGASCAMPLAGRISHRFGSRNALRGLIALWTLSLVLPSLAPNLPTLCLAMFTYGACAGMADVAMNALGVEVERRLGKSIMSGPIEPNGG